MINILVLEDQKDSREALCKMIASYNRENEVEIDSAATYEEAEKLLNNKKTYNGFLLILI